MPPSLPQGYKRLLRLRLFLSLALSKSFCSLSCLALFLPPSFLWGQERPLKLRLFLSLALSKSFCSLSCLALFLPPFLWGQERSLRLRLPLSLMAPKLRCSCSIPFLPSPLSFIVHHFVPFDNSQGIGFYLLLPPYNL